jgi:uncharacterized surface protein with fasciclin (FAS1) repeats
VPPPRSRRPHRQYDGHGPKNIVQTAVAAGKFKTLVALVKKAGLAGTLSARAT